MLKQHLYIFMDYDLYEPVVESQMETFTKESGL